MLPTGKEVKFISDDKLYVYNPMYLNESCNIQTVQENEMLYSNRDVKGAQNAQDFIRKLGYPSISDAIKMISSGKILNCPVTIADLKRAIDIYGPDLASLKGKTVTKKSKIAKFENPIPRFQKSDICLCIDIMFINGISFLTTVSEDLGLLMVGEIKSRSMNHMKDILDTMINYYRSASFNVKMIKTDGESGIIGLSSHLNSRGITINQAGKSQHVPQVERKIRQIKERVRAHISILPFKLTRQLLVQLVLYCVQLINVIPRNDNNFNLSPKELFCGKKLDYSKDFRISFGEYCQIHEDNTTQKNSMNPRTADAIAIKMKGNLQGTAEFLSLSTWKIVSRDKWTTLPMPRTVIEKINQKADLEKNFTKNDFINIMDEVDDLNQPNADSITPEVIEIINANENVREIPENDIFEDVIIENEDVINENEMLPTNNIEEENFQNDNNVTVSNEIEQIDNQELFLRLFQIQLFYPKSITKFQKKGIICVKIELKLADGTKRI